MNKTFLKILFYLIPAIVIVASVFIGSSTLFSKKEIFEYIFSGFQTSNQTLDSIIFNIRIPRILITFMIGGTLAMSGNSLQATLKNPLVCPYILGLSSGAEFGAALSLAYLTIPIQISALVFGFIAVLLTYIISMKKNNVSTVTIILAGVVVSGIFTALLTIVQFFSDPFKLQSIVSWTMGNLHNSSWEKFKIAFIPILVGTTILYFYKWKLNAIALGDEEAKTSGINVKRDKLIILFAVTLATSSAVAISGVIGLFGLIIPHITRMLVGVDNRISMPFNFLFGGSFLLIIDDFSRSFFDFEMPICVLTMLIGAPFFIYLMKKNNIGWE